MISACLTGYIAQVYGQVRYFKAFSDAKLWIDHVRGVGK